MIEQLQQLVNEQQWEAAEQLARQLKRQGSNTDIFWILYAAICQARGTKEQMRACIAMGIKCNPYNSELYYMLGDSYLDTNGNKAALCYQQALMYCEEEEDKNFIQETLEHMKQSLRPVSVVIVAQTAQESGLEACIAAVQRNLRGHKDSITVVTCTNSKGEQIGYGSACNSGIGRMDYTSDILLLSPDIIMLDNALFWLRMALYERESVGAAGPLLNCDVTNQMLEEDMDSEDEYNKLAAEWIHLPTEHSYEESIWLSGMALLIRRNALNSVGAMDERFVDRLYSDYDYGLRLALAGYEMLVCHNSFMYCEPELRMQVKNQYKTPNAYQNYELLNGKWKFAMPYYAHSREELIDRIQAEELQPIRVLEVGCGCGVTLARLKYRYPNAEVHGIELMENVARFGANMADIIVGDIEKMRIPYKEQYFDYILFGDVLEHLRDPAAVLVNMRKYLTNGGGVIASIPNLMNISVIAPLLQGSFTYKSMGLLDSTHIHFFTQDEIIRMFLACGYHIDKMIGRYDREQMTKEQELLAEAIYELPGIADKKQFEIYQYLVAARKE